MLPVCHTLQLWLAPPAFLVFHPPDTCLPASLRLRLRRPLLQAFVAVLDTKALAFKLGHVIPDCLLGTTVLVTHSSNAHVCVQN